MNETDDAQPATAASARAAELIVDFMSRHDGWRKPAVDLTRQRDDVRTAAEREAAALVAKARGEIARILVDTRRELLGLSVQLSAVDRPAHAAASSSTDRSRSKHNVAAELRRDLQQVLSQAQPNLDELATLSRSFVDGSKLQIPDSSKNRFPLRSPNPEALGAKSPRNLTAERPAVTTYRDLLKGWGQQKKILVVVAVVTVTAVPIAGWRLFTSIGRRAPAAAGPELAPKPSVSSKTPPAAGQDAAQRSSPSTTPSAVLGSRQTWLWLLVEARRNTWIQATTDGRTDERRLLQAGDRRRILANQSIGIALGDAGAVTLALNGEEAAIAGRDGQPLTRVFTTEDAENIIALHARDAVAGTAVRGRSNSRADSTRSELLILTQRWLDGYYRGDTRTMASLAAPGMSVGDRRSFQDHLPPGLTRVNRAFDQAQFQQRGEQAMLAARMVEDAEFEGYPAHTVSLVSALWRRQGERWRLVDISLQRGQ
jgi:hypothetical protein